MGTIQRKEREKESRKESIIDAAQKVFFEKGLQLATMDEIAETAELAKGTLYLYYRSKEDLYLAVMMRGLILLRTMFEAVITRQLTTVRTMVEFMATFTGFFEQHRNYFRMFHFFNTPQFHKQVSEAMMAECDRCNHTLWTLVTGVLDRGKAEGTIRTDLSAIEIAVVLWTSSSSLMMRIDSQRELFRQKLTVDLDHTLRVSNILLLESVMTDAGRKELSANTI
ncbi:MAG: TetR/AcrR family transcriptional regulator [Bacteroidetes bacterium]|nr:TetR/AcrR family transcriptional regulator [Bacteroidota bacterium]